MLLMQLFLIALLAAYQGGASDPNGGGAMDPNGVTIAGDGAGLDPHGASSHGDEGIGIDPFG